MGVLLMTILAAGMIGPLDQMVVSPEWLEQNLGNPNVIVVEIGSSPQWPSAKTVHVASWPYSRHVQIPGARFVPIEAIVARNGWPPDELPPVEQLQQAFANAGIGDEGRIILYSRNPLWATRAWFTLDSLGHGERTAILDGGFDRWRTDKRPVERGRRQYAATTFTPRPDSTHVIALAAVRDALEAGDAVLIDARPKPEYDGVLRGDLVVRAGHIPGAHCAPWKTNLDDKGMFRSQAELQSAYEKLAGTPEKRVIVYCRTGMEASMPYFILRSLGYDVALYDGSYTEWSREVSVPVAQLSSLR